MRLGKSPLLLVLIGLITSWLAPDRVMGQTPDKPEWEDWLDRSPWVFLGDSNTYSGGYVAVLDAWLEGDAARPGRNKSSNNSMYKLLNLGVPSETASGLSEVDHPFKRPCVHERLDKVLAMTRPRVVFICYGMNDGIYQPPSDDNLRAYQTGMLSLAERIRATGAKLICLTPPIFEPEPVAAKGNLGPSSEGRYAYFAPAKNYNATIKEQADWCLKNEMGADLVIDVHRLLAEEKKRRRQVDPRFSYSGDGIHFGAEAHRLIAEHVLAELGAPRAVLEQVPGDEQLAAAHERMVLLRDANLSATGKNRPGLPAGYPVWYAEQLAR